MERIRDRVAGLDVHRDFVTACVRAFAAGKWTVVKERFATTMAGLTDLGEWLAGHGVSTVAMEATGVYWRPVYYRLEGFGFDELWLCNAHHVKNVPGRKTDMSDAEWLANVAAHGMVRPSFVPPPEFRALRELTRSRKGFAHMRAREIQRLEKLLQDAGVKLTSVASGVWSQSSRDMVEALIRGERDAKVLASMAKSRLRSKIGQLQEALASGFDTHHAVACRHIIDHIDYLDATLASSSAEIARRVAPYEGAIELLCAIPGISRIVAEIVIAEIGVDMSRFPSAAHLCAWAGVAPGNWETGGRSRPAGTRHGSTWLRRALVEAARSASRTTNSRLGARYRAIARRRGPNKAAVAVAHTMLTIIWHVLSTGETYEDLGPEYYERRNDPQRHARQLAARIEKLGYTVTIEPAA